MGNKRREYLKKTAASGERSITRRIRLSTVNRPIETAIGAHKWIQCANTYRGQRVNIWRTSRGLEENAKAEVIL